VKSGIYILVFPKYGIEGGIVAFDVALLNYLDADIEFELQISFMGDVAFSDKGMLDAVSYIDIAKLMLDQLNDSPAIEVKADFEVDGSKKSITKTIKFKPKMVAKKPIFCEAIDDDAIVFTVYETGKKQALVADHHEAIERIKAGWEEETDSTDSHYLWDANDTVDLHIEHLASKPEALSNTEILDIQMREFERQLDSAIANNQHRLLVIHGIGKGILKNKIHDYCHSHPHVKSFHLAAPWMNGSGATEILL